MERSRFFGLLFASVLALCLFTAGCKDIIREMDSPLSPPAWIQGSWSDQGYIERSENGKRWVFTPDNAVWHDYMYGMSHLAPRDYYQLYLDCLSGKLPYRCELSDLSSDTYYEIRVIFATAEKPDPSPSYLRFIKLTPTTFRFKYASAGDLFDFGVYTKE